MEKSSGRSAKASDNSAWLAKVVSKRRYDRTTRLVPVDMADIVNEIVPDEKWVTGQLEQSGAESGGITTAELRHATKYPRFYAFKLEAIQMAREATITGVYAATAGAALGGALSAIRNAYAYAQGKIDRTQATKNLGVEMMESFANIPGETSPPKQSLNGWVRRDAQQYRASTPDRDRGRSWPGGCCRGVGRRVLARRYGLPVLHGRVQGGAA